MAATVTVTSGGTNMPMSMSQQTGTYGESNALRLVPMGWNVVAGQTYSVTVTGVSSAISYDVQIVDCPDNRDCSRYPVNMCPANMGCGIQKTCSWGDC